MYSLAVCASVCLSLYVLATYIFLIAYILVFHVHRSYRTDTTVEFLRHPSTQCDINLFPWPTGCRHNTISDSHSYLRSHAWIPSAVVACPNLYTSHTGYGKQHVFVEIFCIQWILKLIHLTVNEWPQGLCILLHFLWYTRIINELKYAT